MILRMAIALNLIKKKVGLLLSAFRDRTGERYGRLVVIKHMGKDHRGKHIWLCQCDCGQQKIVVGDNLSNRMCRALHTRNYPEVCEDCAKGIANIIDALKEKTNG